MDRNVSPTFPNEEEKTDHRSTINKPRRFIQRLVLFPLTRLLIALFFIWAAFIFRDVVFNAILPSLREIATGLTLGTILFVFMGYFGYVRLIERRPLREFDIRKMPRELGFGIAIGFCIITTIVTILFIFGYYTAERTFILSIFFTAVITTAATAFWEEIVFRGVLFRILEEGLGTRAALILSAGAFGLLHLGNDNASIVGAINTAALAGVFLGCVYILTRRLWLAIGTHFAVNLTQGSVFGLAVSGREREGLLRGSLDGPELITGGAYGIEASLITTLIGTVVVIYVLNKVYTQRKFIGSMWSKGRSKSDGGIHSELL